MQTSGQAPRPTSRFADRGQETRARRQGPGDPALGPGDPALGSGGKGLQRCVEAASGKRRWEAGAEATAASTAWPKRVGCECTRAEWCSECTLYSQMLLGEGESGLVGRDIQDGSTADGATACLAMYPSACARGRRRRAGGCGAGGAERAGWTVDGGRSVPMPSRGASVKCEHPASECVDGSVASVPGRALISLVATVRPRRSASEDADDRSTIYPPRGSAVCRRRAGGCGALGLTVPVVEGRTAPSCGSSRAVV